MRDRAVELIDRATASATVADDIGRMSELDLTMGYVANLAACIGEIDRADAIARSRVGLEEQCLRSAAKQAYSAGIRGPPLAQLGRGRVRRPAREFEELTIKELLLARSPGW